MRSQAEHGSVKAPLVPEPGNTTLAPPGMVTFEAVRPLAGIEEVPRPIA